MLTPEEERIEALESEFRSSVAEKVEDVDVTNRDFIDWVSTAQWDLAMAKIKVMHPAWEMDDD